MVHLTLDLIAKSRNYLKRSRELSFPDYLMKLTHLHFSGKDIEDIVRQIFTCFASNSVVHSWLRSELCFCRMTSPCAGTSPCSTCTTIGYRTYATWALPPTSLICSCRTTPSLTSRTWPTCSSSPNCECVGRSLCISDYLKRFGV